ncbi:hypothetical protein ACFX1X_030724 [Malus domestica]
MFKLLLFSFDLGPLCAPPLTLFQFISIAILPIKIIQNPTNSENPNYPVGKTVTNMPKKSVLFAVKALLLALVVRSYDYRQHLHPYVILALYFCHMYLGLEIVMPLCATPARALFRFDLEPQSNEPYLSTSLQDFWGRRWNLMVTNILRPTTYDPVLRISKRVVGPR